MTDARESYDPESVAVGGVNLLGLDAAVRYRVLEALALGVRVGWATELADHEYSTRFGNGGLGRSGSLDRNWVQFAIEGRYQPGGSGLYAAVRGGAAAIIDGFDGQSLTQWGPLAGLAFGYDLSVAGTFALGLELQGSLVGFTDDGVRYRYPEPDETQVWYAYGTSCWLGLGLVGSLGI